MIRSELAGIVCARPWGHSRAMVPGAYPPKKSDILIVNHSLLASSVGIQEVFNDENTVCIIDEAHKFPDNYRDQFKQSSSKASINSVYESFITFINNLIKQ